MKLNTVPVDELRLTIRYVPETGEFFALTSSNRRKAGTPAGGVGRSGYRVIRTCGKPLQASRIAWALMTGGWPPALVDHKDRNPRNNKWENLRLAGHADNRRNCAARSPLGAKGAYPTKGGRWRSSICVDGRTRYLGTFSTPELAQAAYARAATEIFGEFARLR